MYQEQFFPTFKGWWRTMTAPKVRHSLRRSSSSTRIRRVSEKLAEAGDAFTLQGSLKPGLDARYAIGGKDFVIDEHTVMPEELVYGMRCTIDGTVSKAGERIALKITVLK